MRKLLFALLISLLVAVPAAFMNAPVTASPADHYAGPYFGDGNLPPGCIADMSVNNPANICHHMRTNMNGLDSPKVDVLVMVPVSPTAERDMRIMRQTVEMWEGGIDYLADEMGLDWLEDGMNFHVTVDFFDPAGGEGGEFTTYPIVDPEIVVIATNPVGGLGIGIDPVDFVFTDENLVPCHTVENPFDFEYWDALPGFDSHHESRSGIYNEDCGGAGGNICFAVNTVADPVPGAVEDGTFFSAIPFPIFDVVAHEIGHCLTIGHVGDGGEGTWAVTPTNDIMAYNHDPVGMTKCVSTLNVEGIATVMSRYLDVNGDGAVTAADELLANDQVGRDGDPFQVQHPEDHWYASSTGEPTDCPQPDLGTVPSGERTDWTPEPVDTNDASLTITSPQDGANSTDGHFDVTGTLVHTADPVDPTETTGSFDDADDDATSAMTEIKALDVAVTTTHVDATMSLADIWPSLSVASPVSYSLVVDGRKFDSFVRYAVDANPLTWDNTAAAYMPAGASKWDLAAKTVSFHIPRDYLNTGGISAPYNVASHANFGALTNAVADDSAPESGDTIGVAGANVIGLPAVSVGASASTVTFEHAGGNTFFTEDSTLGTGVVVDRGTSHTYTLDVPQASDVVFTLSWTDGTDASDLDMFVTGAKSSGSTASTGNNPEVATITDVKGFLNIEVDPYLIADAADGTTYTLTATITPLGNGVDTDGDGVLDADDACPSVAGNGANGCPIVASEQVKVYVDGVLAGTQDVDTDNGPDTFNLPIDLAEGTHAVRVDWSDRGRVIDSASVTVTHSTDDDNDGVANSADACPGFDDNLDQDGDGLPDKCDADLDGDGLANVADNCFDVANADQANMDRDAKGDACDSDMDGDGYSNDRETAQGTDPADPRSFPSGKGGKPKQGLL